MEKGEIYKLEILDVNLECRHSDIVRSILKMMNGKDVKVVSLLDEWVEISPSDTDYPVVKAFITWLKPIEKNEFEEWVKQRAKEYPDINITDSKGCLWEDKDMRDCYEWTRENERKKYKPLIDWAVNRMLLFPDNHDMKLDKILNDLKIKWRK